MIIDLKEVTWQRDTGTIVDTISWQVQAGEHWCLVGQNGSGKTTLLNLINGYIWPTRGEIAVLGQRFGSVDLRDLRKEIGWVSTSLQERLHGQETVESIVLSGKDSTIGLYEQPTDQDVEQAHALMAAFSSESLLQRTYATLSQGERQKVLIARALLASPKLLILDEPCTGLDLLSREQLLQMIAQIVAQPKAPTLIYVTHHIEEILPCFTHALLLKQGRKYRAGKTNQILTSEILSDFYEVQIRVHHASKRTWVTLGEASPVKMGRN